MILYWQYKERFKRYGNVSSILNDKLFCFVIRYRSIFLEKYLKFPGTLRNHNVFNFINVHKYIGLKPMKHYDFKRHYVSALSKGGFSIHINPVIMIARC